MNVRMDQIAFMWKVTVLEQMPNKKKHGLTGETGTASSRI